MFEFNKLLKIKLWCFRAAGWSGLSWKQQSGTHKTFHFVFFPGVTSWFIRGVIKIRTLELNTVFYLPSSSSVFILLIVRGSRMHGVCSTCISQAHNSCRKPHTLLRLMENKFTNSSSSLCRNCSCTRDNFKLFITLFWLLKKAKSAAENWKICTQAQANLSRFPPLLRKCPICQFFVA